MRLPDNNNQQQESVVFMRQLACMLNAGIPVARCLEVLEKTQQSSSVRAIFFKIRKQLLSGHSLYQCFLNEPLWFDHFTCELVNLGEQTGKLDEVLLSIAEHLEKKHLLQRKIKQALFYPCIILTSAILLTLSMIIFIIPSFAALFHDITPSLPLITRMIFAASNLIQQCLPAIVALIISLTAIIIRQYRHGKLSALITSLLTRAPKIKTAFVTLALIRFTRHLALALNAGTPIMLALKLTAEIAGHPQLTRAIHHLRHEVSAGTSLYQAMEGIHLFPALLQQMTKVGEEAGSLNHLLTKTADILELELDTTITQLIRLLEPLIMAVLGALIGGLVIGMYLPVFNLGSTL